ncbi:hypothetical protein MPSEU_000963300 [Mayamaea pseudoterrestris]|nr:hypothetical protein MPSEU_000963300 [Mayamaea pseudoterrestris]
MPRYYDIDAILAEEELIPCTTLFDFSYLSHLDPDVAPQRMHQLPEGSRIKMPLWGVQKWAMMGFVRLSLPRHFQRKSRERIEAEPAEVDLRKRNERFFLSGISLVNLIEASSKQVAKAIANSGRNPRRNKHSAAFEAVKLEADELRKTLLLAYTGDRLGHTLDWALSSVGDDVTQYTCKLTEMERRLFASGAKAISNLTRWKLHGNKRCVIRKIAPFTKEEREMMDEDRENKRQRINQ